ARHFYPRALAVDLQTDTGKQNQHEQDQTEDVKSGCEVEQTAIVRERDRQHRDEPDGESDQLFDPVGFGRLRIPNLNRAEQHDTDGEQRQDPIEVTPTALVNDRDHLVKATDY